jgi:hypothetical protein
MSIDKDRRKYFSPGNMLTILAMAGAIAATYAQSAGEQAKQKERVDQLKEETKEIKRDVKDTAKNVDLILRKLEGIEAAQRERDRQARRQ